MITKPSVWKRTEARLQAQQALSYVKARQLFEALYQEACALRILPRQYQPKDLEPDLRLAEALNHLLRS